MNSAVRNADVPGTDPTPIMQSSQNNCDDDIPSQILRLKLGARSRYDQKKSFVLTGDVATGEFGNCRRASLGRKLEPAANDRFGMYDPRSPRHDGDTKAGSGVKYE